MAGSNSSGALLATITASEFSSALILPIVQDRCRDSGFDRFGNVSSHLKTDAAIVLWTLTELESANRVIYSVQYLLVLYTSG